MYYLMVSNVADRKHVYSVHWHEITYKLKSSWC